MNTYKISYQFPGSSYEDAVVTAPDQRAAEKAFKASFKGTGLKAPDIFGVELVAENTPATKDQEREALEKVSALELDNRDLRLAIKKEKEEASATETALRERVVSDDDLTDCIQMARNAAYEWGEKMEQASASIVELADDPVSPEFVQAVKNHRNAKRAKEYHEALADRLEKKQKHTAGA